MRVIVTGAGGFVGRALVRRLVRDHDVVPTDRTLPDGADIAGDLRDPALLARLFAGGCDAVVHLATTPGGAAEADPDGAWDVNVTAARALADSAAATGDGPRFVFASSIAVLGHPLPADGVDDATPLRPHMLYGAHKAMMEQWFATLDRRGALSAVSLRLPGIVARPAGVSGMRSAFSSDLFHALRTGTRFDAPVSRRATMWLMSVDRVAANIAHAITLPADALPHDRAVTLPALHVTMGDLADSVIRHTGGGPLTYSPDAALEAAFGAQPALATPAADALGFAHDGDIDRLVASALNTLDEGSIG